MPNYDGKNKDYPQTIAPLWQNEYGTYWTYVRDVELDAIQHVQKGGILQIRQVKTRNHEKSPHAYLEFVTKEQMDRNKARRGDTGAPAAAAEDDVI